MPLYICVYKWIFEKPHKCRQGSVAEKFASQAHGFAFTMWHLEQQISSI